MVVPREDVRAALFLAFARAPRSMFPSEDDCRVKALRLIAVTPTARDRTRR
jgi:hypothetical protein